MHYPEYRPRRLRANAKLRAMVAETTLARDHLIQPLFVRPGSGERRPVDSMPGIFQFSVDTLVDEVKEVADAGVPGIILFGIPSKKDAVGSEAYAQDGIVQQAVRAIKAADTDILVVTDVCLCEFTDHGHCGVVKGQAVDNDETLPLLAKEALSHVEAGADMVAPSDMMDGRVGAIRDVLDLEGHESVPILSYAAKYASAYYGPFRDAAESPPQFGDRKSYQMHHTNVEEALREVEMDIAEGADIVMVKPALAYMDVISRVKDEFGYPVAAYNVSGEYAMIKAAAERGWLEERETVLETMVGFRRAGADIILTYWAKQIARWLD